ncbi:hypothetical protein SRABI27_02260 [Pedobacter sp. Bi27]|nr:hypothetical protein SRABI27_02260 [Pedobacter sp. Bi27]
MLPTSFIKLGVLLSLPKKNTMRCSPFFYLSVILAVSLSSCKKNDIVPSPITPEKKPVLVDTSKITGWWLATGTDRLFNSLYIFSKTNVIADYSAMYSYDLESDMELGPDSLVRFGPSHGVIRKLTDDSLTLYLGNKVYRHKRLKIPQSEYGIKTLAKSSVEATACLNSKGDAYSYSPGLGGLGYTSIRKTGVDGSDSFIRIYEPRLYNVGAMTMEDDDHILFGGEYYLLRYSISNNKVELLMGGSPVPYPASLDIPDNVPYGKSWLDTWSFQGLAVAGNGDIYFKQGYVIRRIEKATGIIRTVIGKDKAGAGYVSDPSDPLKMSSIGGLLYGWTGGIYFQSAGYIWKYIASSRQVERIIGENTYLQKPESADNTPAEQAGVSTPSAYALAGNGDLFISSFNWRIKKIKANDNRMRIIAGTISDYFPINGVDIDNALMTRLSPAQAMLVLPNGNVVMVVNKRLRMLYLK